MKMSLKETHITTITTDHYGCVTFSVDLEYCIQPLMDTDKVGAQRIMYKLQEIITSELKEINLLTTPNPEMIKAIVSMFPCSKEWAKGGFPDVSKL